MSTPTANKALSVEEQRELGARLFPEVKTEVLDYKCCFDAIFEALLKRDVDVLSRIENVDIPSEWAYEWTLKIGNRNIMIDRITESRWAFHWGLNMGDRGIMIDRVTESVWAYHWAINIGNRDVMIDRVTEPKWAYYWARNIGDLDIMADRVAESKWAEYWAHYIGENEATG